MKGDTAKGLGQLDYYAFGMIMPGREFSSGGYRYGFNGKEKDDEAQGNGNQYNYGFRIYNPRLGRFLSVDPLTKNYPSWSPYPFAMNRVIDGIDLDGLEYLRADKARVEFKYGKLQLKVENFHNVTQYQWNTAVNDPQNWNGGIGIDPTLASIDIISVVRTPGPTDDPDLPKNINPDGVQSVAVNRAGRREIAQGKQVNTQAGQGKNYRIEAARSVSNGMNALQAFEEAANFVANMLIVDDISKVKEHQQIASKAINDVFTALNDPKYNDIQNPSNILIPEQYRNQSSLVDIMNVVLTGQNNTDNKEIYDIGMKIYNTISQPPVQGPVMMPSKMDNYPSKPIIPATNEEQKN